MYKEKSRLISEVEKSFWELTDLIYYVSQVEKVSMNYFDTKYLNHSDNKDERTLYENVANKLEEAEDALYELIGEKQKAFDTLMRDVIFSSNRTAFEYFFERDFEIRYVDIFMDVFKSYISMIDSMHVSKVADKKEKMQEVIRKITTEALIEIEMNKFG